MLLPSAYVPSEGTVAGLSVCLPACLSVCLSVCMYVCMYVCLSMPKFIVSLFHCLVALSLYILQYNPNV